ADADLPPDPLTAPRPRMPCAEVPARVAAFNDRLKAVLPPKAQITRFVLNPVRQQDADGNCPFASVDIEIMGGNAYFLDRTVDWMRAEPAVDSIEMLRLADGQRRDDLRRFRVVLH
ncbi:MAG TPA: hypothetical protein VJ724_14170, partial [Tahibacter sp.]|nr:hypothetical protein [Tahibacter sp.]